MATARRTRRRLSALLIIAVAVGGVTLARQRALARAEAAFRARHGDGMPTLRG